MGWGRSFSETAMTGDQTSVVQVRRHQQNACLNNVPRTAREVPTRSARPPRVPLEGRAPQVGTGGADWLTRPSRGFPAPPRRPSLAAPPPPPRSLSPRGRAQAGPALPRGRGLPVPILKARVRTPRLLERAPGCGQPTAGAGQGRPRRA